MQPDQIAFLFAFLLVAVFVAIVIWAIIWSRKAETQRRAAESKEDQKRQALARETGWRYSFTPETDIKFRFSGASAGDTAWELHFDLDASSSSSVPKLVFLAKGLATEHTSLMIGDAAGYEAMKLAAGTKVFGAAKLLLDRLSKGKLGDMLDFYKTAQTHRFGTWIVATKGEASVNTSNWSPVIELLSRWPTSQSRQRSTPQAEPKPDISRNADGLKIIVPISTPETAMVKHLERVGNAVCAVLEMR